MNGGAVTQEELDKFDPYKLAYTQLKNSLATVNIFLLIMEVLEILTDMLTFSDMLKENDYWNAGVIGGKGFVNGGFTIYYIVMQYWKLKDGESGVVHLELEFVAALLFGNASE